MLLRGVCETTDPRLDRIYPGVGRHLRSLNYLVSDMPLASRPFRSYTWPLHFYLDQGMEGRCVEFSICHEFCSTPKPIPMSVVEKILSEKLIYWPAQRRDYWPGGSYPGASPFYEGTSVLSGSDVAREMGFYSEVRWAMTVEEMALAVGYAGPVVIGVDWYGSFFRPDSEGWIFIGNSSVAGGHAILASGVRVVKFGNREYGVPGEINYDRSYFTLHNSWGPDWGVRGRCRISWRDMATLIRDQGEVMVPSIRVMKKVLVGV